MWCFFKIACGRSKGVCNCGILSILSHCDLYEVRCRSRNIIKSILKDIRGKGYTDLETEERIVTLCKGETYIVTVTDLTVTEYIVN